MTLWNDVEDPGYDQGDGAYVGGYEAPPAAPPTAPTAPTAPTDGGVTGGGGGGAVAFSPSGMPGMTFRPLPRFVAPEFKAPSAADVLASPGYQFRLGQGQQGIERSAAARGLLRTGGTLKDIAEYNQNFASGEFQNEFNRSLQSFGTRYQGAKDEYAPLLAQWQTMANADLQRALAAYGRDTIWYNPNAQRGGGGGGGVYDPEPEWNE